MKDMDPDEIGSAADLSGDGAGVSDRVARLHGTVGFEPPTMRRADIAAGSGVDPDRTIRWWRAMGFPEVGDDTVAFNDLDLDLVQRLGEMSDAGLIGDDDVLRLARLLGASFQRIAEAQLALADELLANVPGADPDLLSRDRLAALIDSEDPTLMKLLERSVVYVWRRHMLAALGRRLSTEDDTDELAVGFADMSGFTKLSKSMTPNELTALIDQFEYVAFDVVSATDGRVVKLIGDEVMFVAPTLVSAVRIGLELGERLREIDAMPPIHCGIALGPTVTVGGDVFGTTVNLASRLTTIARKATVVIPRDLADRLAGEPDIAVRPLRRNYTLKGMGDTRIAVVSRADVPAADKLRFYPIE